MPLAGINEWCRLREAAAAVHKWWDVERGGWGWPLVGTNAQWGSRGAVAVQNEREQAFGA
jgi:hypothetical protein